jgi:glycosyltransferase involved in cell wall biosynthesis
VPEFRTTESYGFLSTYPPTQCGLATFTDSLATHIGDGTQVGIVRVVDRFQPDRRGDVVHQLVTGEAGSEAGAAAALNRFDVAVVQHEYGIYSGRDGDAVVGVLRGLRVPAIVVLHTVLADPTAHQRKILEEVVAAADAAVVMTSTAQRRLLDGYAVDADKVALIPHGAPTDWAHTSTGRPDGAATILTWGLLGPGKGIEWALEAVAWLGDLDPAPRYLIAGETHPKVLAREGTAYRDGLMARVAELGIGDRVDFDDRYLDLASLRQLVASAAVVVLPYDSRDQVTSGVLIEAVTCRRPVVATAFPHAMELLMSGAGTVVPQGDALALAGAIRRILTEPELAESMVRAAERLAPDLTWRAVADRYRHLGRRLVDEAVPVGA